MFDVTKIVQFCAGLWLSLQNITVHCLLPSPIFSTTFLLLHSGKLALIESTSADHHCPLSSFRHKPVSIAAYSMGPFGGIRAAQLARWKHVYVCYACCPFSLFTFKIHVNWSAFDIPCQAIWYSPCQANWPNKKPCQAIPLWAWPGPSSLNSAHPHCPGSKSLREMTFYQKLLNFAECQHPRVWRGGGQREGDEEHGEDLQGARLVRGRPRQACRRPRPLPHIILPI